MAVALLGLGLAAVIGYLFLDRPLRVVDVLGELAPGEVREVRREFPNGCRRACCP